MKSPKSHESTSTSVTKRNLLKQYSSKSAAKMTGKLPPQKQYKIELEKLPMASGKEKEMMKMESIFNEYVAE